MNTTFLCDENVEEETVSELSKRDFSAIHAVNDPGSSALDSQIAATVREKNAILITTDSDFLDRSRHGKLGVFYYPEHNLSAYRVAIRVEAALEMISDLEPLRSHFCLSSELEPE